MVGEAKRRLGSEVPPIIFISGEPDYDLVGEGVEVYSVMDQTDWVDAIQRVVGSAV